MVASSLASCSSSYSQSVFFFYNTAPTMIYTLSLHDALPIFAQDREAEGGCRSDVEPADGGPGRSKTALGERQVQVDRKSTRLNSSHGYISYAVFCLKKKK